MMVDLRRALGPLTAIWLSCQIGTLVLVPAALCITAADAHGAECTCGHGPHAMCPMHHKSSPGSKRCVMQAVDYSGTAILTSLVGVTGVVTEETPSILPAVPSGRLQANDAHLTGERPVPPDPPPPRL